MTCPRFDCFIQVKLSHFCYRLGFRMLYLSTQGQEGFYCKLGYEECEPICIYGGYMPVPTIIPNKIGNSELWKYQVVQLPVSHTLSSLPKSLSARGLSQLPPSSHLSFTSLSSSLTKNTLVFSKKTFMRKLL